MWSAVRQDGFHIVEEGYSGQLRVMFKLAIQSERNGLHICDMKYTCDMEYSNLLSLK